MSETILYEDPERRLRLVRRPFGRVDLMAFIHGAWRYPVIFVDHIGWLAQRVKDGVEGARELWDSIPKHQRLEWARKR